MRHLDLDAEAAHRSSGRIGGWAQRGVTLVELLVVVFILAVASLAAVENLNGMYRRTELEGSAATLTAFLDSVPDHARQQHQSVFLIWNPPEKVVSIAEDAAGQEVLQQMLLPSHLLVSPRGSQIFRCDTLGRAFAGGNPASPFSSRMLAVPQELLATHEAIEDGRVEPRIRYRFTLSPLWHVTTTKEIVEEGELLP